MSRTVHVEGLRELRKSMDRLETKLQKRIYQKAAGKAGRLVVQAAKAKVPRNTGTLARSVSARVSSKPRQGLFGVKVSVRGGLFASNRTANRKGRQGKDYKPDAVERYYRFVETGTKYHPAQAFLLPSLEDQRGPILEVFKREIAAGIESHRP